MPGRPGPEYRPPDQRGFLSPAELVALMLKRRRGELPAPQPQRREGFLPFIPLSDSSGPGDGNKKILGIKFPAQKEHKDLGVTYPDNGQPAKGSFTVEEAGGPIEIGTEGETAFSFQVMEGGDMTIGTEGETAAELQVE